MLGADLEPVRLHVREIVAQNVFFQEVLQQFQGIIKLKGVVMFAHDREQQRVDCLGASCLDGLDVLDKLPVNVV